MMIKNVWPMAAMLLVLLMTSCHKDDDSGIGPVVTSTYPANKATNIAINSTISATFSTTMNPSTITIATFAVTHGSSLVSGVVSYIGKTATFTPVAKLTPNTSYTATISTEAKDSSGISLEKEYEWSFTTNGTVSSVAKVDLGAAVNYVILAKTAISNISTSAVTGDLGLSPAATSYITGFTLTDATGYATSAQVTGKIYAADMAAPTAINLTTAVENMMTAYTDAAGRALPNFVELETGNIGGKTLQPGLYKWTNSVFIASDITISGNASDVWIFQIAGNLTLSNTVNVILKGGAQAKNIFWQVAGEAMLKTTSHFEGILLSMTGITFENGASMNGRALAQTAIVLDSNTITKP